MSRDQKFFDLYSLVIGILAAAALATGYSMRGDAELGVPYYEMAVRVQTALHDERHPSVLLALDGEEVHPR